MFTSEEREFLETVYKLKDGKMVPVEKKPVSQVKQDDFWSLLTKGKDKPPEGKPSKPSKDHTGVGPSGDKKDKPQDYKKPEKWISAGGVVLAGEDDLDRLWIRKAKGAAYGGWTFAKGMVDKGETKEVAALREVEEEMGIKAEIVPGAYLGTYEGGYSITHYYLMYAKRVSGKHDNETEKVALVTWTEAVHKFAKSGNTRDIKALNKAMEEVEKIKRARMARGEYARGDKPEEKP